jgi:hypothetical protein
MPFVGLSMGYGRGFIFGPLKKHETLPSNAQNHGKSKYREGILKP